MKISVKNIQHIAKLANLKLIRDEEDKYSTQLSKILEYIDLLNKVDTFKIEPTFNTTGIENVKRQDSPEPCLTQKQAISNVTNSKTGYFVSKSVFENQ